MKKRIITILTVLSIAITAGCGTATVDSLSATSVSTEVSVPENGFRVEDQENEDLNLEAVEEEKTFEENEPEEISLKDIYAEHGLKVGTCLTPSMISSAGQSSLILSQFNSVTMENAMKPESILSKKRSAESGELTVYFNDDMVAMLDWAKENNMALRGHTLVWYSQTPKWIFCENFDPKGELVSRDEMLKRMESMISQVFAKLEEEGYSDLFYAYDIVNEAWLDNGTMRKDDNYWYKIIGDDYLWYAFYYANKYAPEHIDLYYNDFNEQFKTAALVNFVNTLVDEDGNYLIDGIGLQAHLYTSDDITQYLHTVETLGATGLKVQMTELDVCLGSYQNTLPANEENLLKQGRYYYNLINGIFELVDSGKVNMDAITYWGYCDSMSWRRSQSPLLYNAVNKPKYAYYGAAQIKELAGFGTEE